jgi:hypothetical protein
VHSACPHRKATSRSFNEAVHNSHDLRAAVKPKSWSTNRHNSIGRILRRVIASWRHRTVTQSDRAAHGKTHGHDPFKTHISQVPDRHVKIEHLIHSHGAFT